MKKRTILLGALIATTALWAADFTVNNIAYNKLGGDSAEVTSKSDKYSDSISIPSTVTYESTTYRVTSIGAYAFNGCSKLTKIRIPNSVTRIGEFAFSNCSSLPVEDNIRYADTYLVEAVDKTLSTCAVKEGTKWIGDMAFMNCHSLKWVSIPNSMTSIGSGAFYGCDSLTSIRIPNSVTRIGVRAFYGCSSFRVDDNLRYADTYLVEAVDKTLSTYTISVRTKWIGDEAFLGCDSLQAITIPKSVIQIGVQAFNSCSSLRSINVDAANTHYVSVDSVLFNYAKDTLIQYPIGHSRTVYAVPNSVIRIGEYAFSGCHSLRSITVPNSVTNIGERAFSNCSSLRSVRFGNGVTRMRGYAFYNCKSLDTITCYATTPPTCDGGCFLYVDKTIPLYVPVGSVQAYKDADVWKDFTNIKAIIAAEEVEEPVTTATTTSDMYSVTITWPTSEDAESYTIVIKKGTIDYCTLTFNADGQLLTTNYAQAPERGANNRMSAMAVAGGYRFTITGLDSKTTYNYEVDTKDAAGTSIANYTGTFTTTSTALNQLTDSPIHRFTKVMKDGQLLIIRDGEVFDARGVKL